ncbi:hypothetical protein DOM22_07205 [Bdellovibrio sp. ZAP7]|nr:hypothetical protein DOM22_07205 [Bdellovibrio sp. ZAP7]
MLDFEVTRTLKTKKWRFLNFKNFEKHFDEIPSETVVRKFKISFIGSTLSRGKFPVFFFLKTGNIFCLFYHQ